MIQHVDELRAALAGTPLQHNQIASLPVLDTGQLALLIEIRPSSALESWRVARELVASTGRWPVAVTCWSPERPGPWPQPFASEDLFNRFYFEEGAEGLDVSPAALIQRATDVDLPSALARDAKAEDEIKPLADAIDEALAHTAREFGEAPTPAEVEAAELHGAPLETSAALDRWLAQWELEHFGDRVRTRETIGPQSWFEPDMCALLLPPTPSCWEVLAYLSWYAGSGRDDAELIALARSWHQRFGAELVAHWGTMLQWIVTAPPADESSAWAIAHEHTLVAPDTIVLPGTPLRDYARGLIGADRWFLHDRP